MERKLLKIKLIVKEYQTKDGSRKFNSYCLVDKEGHLNKCKFTKSVVNIPTQTCFIEVYADQLSHQTNIEFPCWWVRSIENVIAIEKKPHIEETLPF